MSTPHDPPLSRRAARQAEQSTADAVPESVAQPLTRRTRGGSPTSVPSSSFTDVDYRTQVRPRVPRYDTQPPPQPVQLVEPSAAAPVVAPIAPPFGALGADHARRRDFRPRAEQDSPAESHGDAPLDTAFDADLEYHTHQTPRREALVAASPAEAVEVHVIVVPQPEAHVDLTLSRREIRARREQVDVVPEVAPAPAPAPAEIVVLAEPDRADRVPSAASVASDPTGSHWSVGIHDTDDPFENTLSRQVGSTASLSNTNALVLPKMPSMSIGGPVSNTGEIIVTGMIDLPRSVSSTGAMPTRHESPDIDDLFDAADFDTAPPDSAPVSALKAVSSHAVPHSMLVTSKRPAGGTVATVLVASTVVMAVVAIGLFIVAAVNGLF